MGRAKFAEHKKQYESALQDLSQVVVYFPYVGSTACCVLTDGMRAQFVFSRGCVSADANVDVCALRVLSYLCCDHVSPSLSSHFSPGLVEKARVQLIRNQWEDAVDSANRVLRMVRHETHTRTHMFQF